MPPKNGGTGTGPKKRIRSLEGTGQRPSMVNPGPTANRASLAQKTNQSNFSIAPLILEGVKIGKLELNDLLKQHLAEAKISDIQLSRAGIFTLYFVEVTSFNKVLNELPALLNTNGHTNAKVYVPRSIQRIKDTERVAFVKRVEVEIPEARIAQALKDVGLLVLNVDRLRSKDGNTPTRTVKITFEDAANRNTFVRTGLQVDSMHFDAEAASHNMKPVQCYMCLQYNHIAKYCKTKQQKCPRCGEDHRVEQCKVGDDKVKCCNCKGNHLATSSECSSYQEQEKRVKKLISQYSSNNTTTTSTPPTFNNTEYPPLPAAMRPDFFNEIINVLSSKMEKLVTETMQRLVSPLQKKIEELEKALSHKNTDKDAVAVSESESSNDECAVTKYMRAKAQKPAEAATTASSSTTTTTTSSTKPKPSKKSKRAYSPNSSLESSTNNNKDPKT